MTVTGPVNGTPHPAGDATEPFVTLDPVLETALDHLRQLIVIITRDGGYMDTVDQGHLRAARAFLAHHGP